MQYIFTLTQFCIQGNRRVIAIISLNKYYPCSGFPCSFPDFGNQRYCYAPSPICLRYSEIINVDFAAFLFQLG